MREFSIGEVVDRTGVAEATLRMWERRHGFPIPSRLASGHRRYSEQQLEQVRAVARWRDGGVSLPIAIERAQALVRTAPGSLFATLRRRRPELQPAVISKRVLVALSHAIEDEILAGAERPVLFASFQRARFYRQSERRWRELVQGAAYAAIFADFPRPRTRRGGVPIEIRVPAGDPLTREWSIVSLAQGHAVCLVGREPAGSGADDPSASRAFETIWTVEPDVVQSAAEICAANVVRTRRKLPAAARGLIEQGSAADLRGQLRLAAAITARALETLSVTPEPARGRAVAGA